jgi:thiosulfate/3-mercaptopyruvate sulfurtransferase
MRKMKLRYLVPALLLALAIPFASTAAAAAPVVTTDWLQQNLNAPNQVIVDIRKVEEYKAGHIPNSVSAVYETWAIKRGSLVNELPAEDDLRDALGAAGIRPDSKVVVIGKLDAPPDRANIARVAWTMKYAGVANVLLVNGSFNKWVADKKPVSTDPARPRAAGYDGKFNPNVLTTKDYIMKNMGKVLLVDVREKDFYTGQKKLDFVARAGHLKGAVNLPTSAVFNSDGSYKDKAVLAAIAAPVIGADLNREIIVYCDSGRVASTWWFLLSEVLGYKSVKLYDGSIQDWAADPNAPIEAEK